LSIRMCVPKIIASFTKIACSTFLMALLVPLTYKLSHAYKKIVKLDYKSLLKIIV
jgi:hypothetical protein